MNYYALTSEYWQQQVERLKKVIKELRDRPQAAVPGRVVPEPAELAIGTGRRLFGAVLFTDISGFSDRDASTHAAQEVQLRVLNLYFSELIRVAEEYGGTVEKNTGDGLMAYFEDNGGDPPAEGALRAVSAALTMMYVTEKAINAVLRQSNVDAIQFRVGIDHGPITIAEIGSARRYHSLVAIGASANVASKMLNYAQPGDIIVGANVYKRLPRAFQSWCEVHKTDTGWVYVQNNTPYWFYKYKGRWKDPVQQ